jgi:hypothetical protein
VAFVFYATLRRRVKNHYAYGVVFGAKKKKKGAKNNTALLCKKGAKKYSVASPHLLIFFAVDGIASFSASMVRRRGVFNQRRSAPSSCRAMALLKE